MRGLESKTSLRCIDQGRVSTFLSRPWSAPNPVYFLPRTPANASGTHHVARRSCR